MANTFISIPDPHPNVEWEINSTDQVFFVFLNAVNNFAVHDPKFFTPDVPSGGFGQGNIIGPYAANTKNQKTAFTYSPDNHRQRDDAHTILIGN